MPPRYLTEASEEELRQRTSIKWSRVPPGVIAADIAELDFRAPEPVVSAVRRCADGSDLGYPDYSAGGPGTPARLAEVFCGRMQTRFGWTPDPARVETSGQIMQALCCAVLSYTNPGDTVLTHAPTYRPIAEAIRRLDRRCLTVQVSDIRDVSDWTEATKEAGIPRVPMVVLCHPHNPTGYVFDSNTLSVLAEFAERNDAVIFSDEIYQDLVYDPAGYRSTGAVAGLNQRTVMFTSAAKSFGIAGLRCAVGYFGSRRLHEDFCRLPWHLRSTASLPGINATIAAWSQCETWLDELRSRLAANREIVTDRLADIPSVRCVTPAATYSCWLDLSDTVAAADPREYLIRAARVSLQAGESFGAEYKGNARLNFGTAPERLAAMLDRLSLALRA